MTGKGSEKMNNKTHRITAEVPIGIYERLLVYALDAQDMRQKLERRA